jgi:transcription-repair coupling factor (superfamily II helicase)
MESVRLEPDRPARVVGGIAPSARAAIIEECVATAAPRLSVLLLPHLKAAEALADTIEVLHREIAGRDDELEILLLPPPLELEEEEDTSPAAERALDRAAVFSRLRDRSRESQPARLLLLTEGPALFAPAPPPDALDARSLILRRGEILDRGELARRLQDDLGYDAEAVCEYPGQFAPRGGLLDVYPPNGDAPVRIDYFGDEIESLRRFDPTTQRSEEEVESVTLAPRIEGEPGLEEANAFLAYLAEPVQWLWWEAAEQVHEHPALYQTYQRIDDKRAHFGRVFQRPGGEADCFAALGILAQRPDFLPATSALEEWRTEAMEALRGTGPTLLGMDRAAREATTRQELLAELRARADAGEAVCFLAHNAGEAERLRGLIAETAGDPPFPFELRLGALERGFRILAAGGPRLSWMPPQAVAFNLVAESDLLGRLAARAGRGPRRRLPQRSQVDHLLDFSELVEGDHLVHLAHGVCVFRGLAQLDLGDRIDDVISVEFADQVTLHLPLHESHLLTRYVGLTKASPRLGRLGSAQWEKARREAEKATVDYAAEMLRLQAVRSHEEGHAFAPDNDWQRMFEAAFPYPETRDQLLAIEAAKADMERQRPMDRLLCGDVGFGKTEVAIRAAFKAVMDGKQVAILVPTTVLAQQHFNTLRERMAEYPVTVEMLSRFRRPEQQKAILQQVRSGGIDILVGTHRLLSSDLKFADLGLLVVDEEHRFGVRHKERLKQLRTHVDVLTMSATPIPRTLYLALMGARDLSTIETPPANRRPIETIVRSYDPETVRKAIVFELERGGQVFYLHNRVQTIEAVAERLREMVPGARIGVGHGQMEEDQLEEVMTRFVAGDHDVLVCTTIIENGLDIPNCNTLIIEGADRFGLAQLYQLRGRVGRFNRQAYAYLLLHRHRKVLQVARERLAAMRHYNQLGAGFKIAMRDLELRGAGNLLGPQQSGHVASVGFELYCQLLRQSVARLKGEDAAAFIRATVSLDFVHLGGPGGKASAAPSRDIDAGFGALKEAELADNRVASIEAALPLAYVGETRLRIEFYRRLALAETTAEVDRLGGELRDRFGPPPPAAEVLLLFTRLRTLAQEGGFSGVETEGNRLKVRRASGRRDDFVKIGSRFPRLTAKNPLRRLREIEQFLLRHRPKTKK